MTVASELGTLLAAAAATMTAPTAATVTAGEPDNVNLPTFAYWYTGTKTWEANTFTASQELSSWHIRVYAPAGARYTPIDGGLEGWIESAVNAVRGQVLGKYAMGGASTGSGSWLSDATAGWAQPGGQMCRVADMDLDVAMTAVHPITA